VPHDKGRKSVQHLIGVEQFMRDVVAQGAVQRAADNGTAWRADIEPAIPVEERWLTGFAGEHVPELVRTPDERDVHRMLEIRFPDDARRAVRGALIVRRDKPVDADDALTPPREMVKRGAAHGAESHDHGVVEHPGTWWAARSMDRHRPAPHSSSKSGSDPA
jgi:hypothetical protein